MSQTAYVYIDGFNFYYGVYVGRRAAPSSLKWIDYVKLSELLLKAYTVEKVKYFTARVNSIDDPGRPGRQQTHWRALQKMYPNRLEIIEGKFRTDPKRLPVAQLPDDSKGNTPTKQKIWVIRTEEKGSDVNLASHLMFDAGQGRFDTALVMSNDSDLFEAVRIVTADLKKHVILANPYSFKGYKTVAELAGLRLKQRIIRYGLLNSCQLPDPIPNTTITKPNEWV